MKTIGMVGGIGPESTIDYYRSLLERARTLGLGRQAVLINSIDVDRVMALATSDRPGLVVYLTEAVETLARAGAGVGFFAANTPHIVFDEVQRRVSIPLVSIVEATGQAAASLGLRRVGLLGTRVTMTADFYPKGFAAHGIAVVAPRGADLDFVHDKYYGELVQGRFLDETRARFIEVIDRMRAEDSIDGVVLGGMELPLLLRGTKHALPFLDTTRIHVEALIPAGVPA